MLLYNWNPFFTAVLLWNWVASWIRVYISGRRWGTNRYLFVVGAWAWSALLFYLLFHVLTNFTLLMLHGSCKGMGNINIYSSSKVCYTMFTNFGQIVNCYILVYELIVVLFIVQVRASMGSDISSWIRETNELLIFETFNS